jgi:hypothetical protein
MILKVEKEKEEEDIKDFMDAQLFSLRIAPIRTSSSALLTQNVYPYLTIITEEQPKADSYLEGFYSVRY